MCQLDVYIYRKRLEITIRIQLKYYFTINDTVFKQRRSPKKNLITRCDELLIYRLRETFQLRFSSWSGSYEVFLLQCMNVNFNVYEKTVKSVSLKIIEQKLLLYLLKNVLYYNKSSEHFYIVSQFDSTEPLLWAWARFTDVVWPKL